MIIIMWIFLSFIVAFIGNDRKIGYGGTLLLSLLLSPLIGVIFALASQRKQTVPVVKILPEVQNKYNRAKKEFNKGNYNTSIELLESALKISPNSKLILYNLSICYSTINDSRKSFHYLKRAIEEGYNDFKRIQENPNLMFLREQPEFIELVN